MMKKLFTNMLYNQTHGILFHARHLDNCILDENTFLVFELFNFTKTPANADVP